MSNSISAKWLRDLPQQTLINSGKPLFRQVYELLRKAILSQELPPGTRLPASRQLAEALAVSRNTIISALGQLVVEGYIESHVGSGSYVRDTLPETPRARGKSSLAARSNRIAPTSALSQRGQNICQENSGTFHEIQPFTPSSADFSVFPHNIWLRLQNKIWRQSPTDYLDYANAGGYLPLRQAIADYLSTARSAQVTAEQVLITGGTQQSLMLCAQLLANANDTVWLEDPGYWGAQKVFAACDLRMHPCPVDNEGLVLPQQSEWRGTAARLIYVTPSHQYPSGVVMSLARRRRLLQQAAAEKIWVLEDDYDSEFRYHGRPLASLQALDSNERVIYLGTFSKILFPGIKIAYIVTPPAITVEFQQALYDLQRPGLVWLQACLAEFIREGHFATHIRRLQKSCGERRRLLANTLTPLLAGYASISKEQSGLHLVIDLHPAVDDNKIVAQAAEHGLTIRSLSSYYRGQVTRKGLIVGYAYVAAADIEYYAKLLAQVICAVAKTPFK